MKQTILLVVVACGTGTDPEVAPPSQSVEVADAKVERPSAEGSGQPQQPQPVLTGLPCDVRAVLQTNCATCHAENMAYTRQFSSRVDLMETLETGKTLGATAVDRMASTKTPMPPLYAPSHPSAADRDVVARWVASGMPGGACEALK